jgi:hypothetical protein
MSRHENGRILDESTAGTSMSSTNVSNGRPQHRVLIVIGDASETLDTLYPYYRLQEAGFEPVVVGPKKGWFRW